MRSATGDKGLRRRLLVLGLGLTPADIKHATGADSVKVSVVLSGSGRLRPEQATDFGRVIAKRARELFTA